MVVFIFLRILCLPLMQFFSYCSFCLFFDIISLGSFSLLNYFFYLDFFTFQFLSILFVIVVCIFSFISYYFVSEVKLTRFVYLLNLFVFSMVMLIVSPGLVSLLLGWDGLGFVSFVLVCWFNSAQSYSASFKTFLVNRLGDALFVCGLTILFVCGGYNYLNSFALVLFIALFTKSALFPFRYWLPEAMAAPTPVSSLVHSSTLVVAGLYVLFRYFALLPLYLLFCLVCVGLFTLFYGRLQALITYDSKKLVAYSTLRQLGFLSFFLGLGLLDLFYSYLLVHAVFKASLFVSVGTFIVTGGHNQDMRYLRSLWFLNPTVSLVFFFSVFSLSGFPFLSCFFYKDLLIGVVVNLNCGLFVLFIFFRSLMLTVFYSFRLLFILHFNRYSFISVYTNTCYPVVSTLLFSCMMLFYGLWFSFDYSLWLHFSNSLLVLVFILFSVLCCFYSFVYLSNIQGSLLNVFYSGFSYVFSYLFSVRHLFDLNLFLFRFILFLESYIYVLYSRFVYSNILSNLIYLILFSSLVGLLMFSI